MERLPAAIVTSVSPADPEPVGPARQPQSEPGGHRERPPPLTANEREPRFFHGNSGLPLGIEAGESSRGLMGLSTAAPYCVPAMIGCRKLPLTGRENQKKPELVSISRRYVIRVDVRAFLHSGLLLPF